MNTSRKFAQKVRRGAQEHMGSLGLFRHRKVYFLRHEPNVWGSVGLADIMGRDDGVYEINPIVGVTHLRAEALVASLKGETLKPFGRTTVSTPLYKLMPGKKWRPWEFDPSTDWQAVLDDMMVQLSKYGLPFIKANLDLRAACATLEAGEYGNPSETLFSLPAGLLLLGKAGQMEKVLEGWLREKPDSAYYRKYAEDLRKLATRGKVDEFVREAMPDGFDL